ncbi:acyl-CoA dehydrogenase [Paenibacillus alvei]|uniref:Acyl-CoA dehydrogenase n=1 Tax=Paenibacillus alvei TaxID=44250 RepID=A0A383RCZ3_PAEAL|nr:acyl-CoA dehydrogenase [Paenibacillus alvei]SYX84888.1 Acyl-CoA dehydrogenase [Paenibacillus alvei]
MNHFTDEEIRIIRDQALTIEREGKLPQQLLQWIYERGLFKLFVPAELQGNMTELPEALKWFEHTSWINGSFGWLVTIGSGGGFFAPFMTPEVAKDAYKRKDAVVAGSGHPSGTAVKVEGGYRVSGRWKFCSGSTYATVFTANCSVKDQPESDAVVEFEGISTELSAKATEAESVIRSFVFWPDEVEIVQDWNAFGLRATESHSIVVHDVFVHDERSFSIMEPNGLYDNPIYSYPFLPFAEASFAAVSIGLATHFLEEARNIAERNRTVWEHASVNRYEAILNKIMVQNELLTEAVSAFYQAIEQSWNEHTQGKVLTDTDVQEVSFRCKEAGQAALSSANALFPYLGIHAVMEDAPINQIYRDLQTVCHHSLLVKFD